MLDVWDATHQALPPAAAAAAADLINTRLAGLRFASSDGLTALRPVELAPEVRERLAWAARRLVNVIHRYCWALTGNPRELAKLCGMEPRQQPFLGALDPALERALSSCNARPDALLRNGTPVFLEANFGAANSSPITTNALLPVYEELYGCVPKVGDSELREPFAARARLYGRLCAELRLEQRILIVGTVREPDVGSVRYLQSEADFMASAGFESEYVEPEFFSAARGREVARSGGIVLKHFLPEEWLDLGFDIAWKDLREAHRNMVWLVPDSGLSLSSKLVLAWLSANCDQLDVDDRAFVREHIPWTRVLDGTPLEFMGTKAGPEELLTRFQAHLVVKPATSCAGQGVLVGRATPADVWTDAVRRVMSDGTHIVQEHVQADDLEMDFYDASTGAVIRRPISYVLGPYVVDGMSAGCSVRHAISSEDGVVNHARGAAINLTL
ncbi:hypothetical protein [Nonomuraea sp. NPDC005692]|uniref:hypothetical protein n=1 Tax=Nonomuraea sp. NPDC005692 TaxID=3157168 RepID=UPI0033EB2FB4